MTSEMNHLKKKVVIIGAGIAGMTTAHELAERGFDVEIHEAGSVVGGKARSIPLAGSGIDGRADLPGEHGFRFFPGFYRHITDTMKRIPFPGNSDGVLGNLINTSHAKFIFSDQRIITAVTKFPSSFNDLQILFHSVFRVGMGLQEAELNHYIEKIWQILTSCEERSADEYERIGWWDFLEANGKSAVFQNVLADGLTRTLVAAEGRTANTRTMGQVCVQLINDMFGGCSDRVLNGPTNDVWLTPWRAHLENLGVRFYFNSRMESFNCESGRITGLSVKQDGVMRVLSGDFYLLCVPVEVAAKLISPSVIQIDPTLASICSIQADSEWMVGVQFYLNRDVSYVHGHLNHMDAPWALTSIFQQQFWSTFPLDRYGDGSIRAILSVDISDWKAPGVIFGKPANQCTRDEIRAEVWEQLKRSLNRPDEVVLEDNFVCDFFIGPNIKFDPVTGRVTGNDEPLFVNKNNSWGARPNSFTRIPNLLLASDYVRTNTNLATMESANEAGRRAVNCIIDASANGSKYCKIWPIQDPPFLVFFRRSDRLRYRIGLPWSKDVFFVFRILQMLRSKLYSIFGPRRSNRFQLGVGDSIRAFLTVEDVELETVPMNISTGGVGVYVAKKIDQLKTGQTVKLTLKFGDGNSFVLDGIVRHILSASESQGSVGIEFANPPPEVSIGIKRYLRNGRGIRRSQ